MSAPLLRLARGADGTEWVWSGTAETSDPLACEVRDAAASAAHDGEPAVELSFSRRLGRYVRARRAIGLYRGRALCAHRHYRPGVPDSSGIRSVKLSLNLTDSQMNSPTVRSLRSQMMMSDLATPRGRAVLAIGLRGVSAWAW